MHEDREPFYKRTKLNNKPRWLKTYEKELRQRNEVRKTNPKLFKDKYSPNPKGLERKPCKEHLWVPATHLWIHDRAASTMIEGYPRRGFKEAKPYRVDGNQIVPQICTRCVAAREHVIVNNRVDLFSEMTQKKTRRRRKAVTRTKSTKRRMTSNDELFG